MRSAGNFHPEWGYLAPTPSFMRTLRIALVATAVGATAGAGVVVALIAHPGSGRNADSSIAAHALVTSVPAVNSASAATAAPAQSRPAPVPAQAATAGAPPAAASPQPAAPAGEIGAARAGTAKAAPAAPQVVAAPDVANGAAPAHTAPIEEPAAAPVHEDTALLPDAAPSKKTATRKRRVSGYEAIRRWQASREAKKPHHDESGFEPLLRLFSSRTGSLFSAN
jgi:hypothetical protein